MSFFISWSLLKLLSIEPVMPSNHLILCRPLSLLSSIFSRIRVFSDESILPIRRPQYWSLSISPSNEYLGLISFRIDWFDLLAVQGTLKSLLQHHHSKASVLQCSAFFMVQLLHPWGIQTFQKYKQHIGIIIINLSFGSTDGKRVEYPLMLAGVQFPRDARNGV